MSNRLVTALLIVSLALVGSAVLQAQPSVGDNGVVDAANPFNHTTAPGSIVSIFGTNLAAGTTVASTVPLSSSLGGTSVTFNGIAAPLFFTGMFQINAQLPSGLTGTTASIVVTTASGPSAAKTIQIAPTAPAIFTLNQTGSGQGVVLIANTSTFVAPVGAIAGITSQPAKAGDVLTIYANSLGPVDIPVADGNNTLDALRRTKGTLTIKVGAVDVPPGNILFSGLAPQFVSLYQINFTMPPGVPAGDKTPIQIAIDGVASTGQVTIATQ